MWVTTKDGRRVNTDWFDKDRQIAENKKQADERNKNYTPLYHGSDYKSMLKILTSNKLIAQASPKDVDGDVVVSFARSLGNAYGQVAVELSRESLQDNYSLRPIQTYIDPDEERTPKTISDLSKHIRAIRWVDSSRTGIYLKTLRRELVENFDNADYTNTPGSHAYYIKQIAEIADKKGIPVDKRFAEALGYIQKFDKREFDTERYQQMKDKAKNSKLRHRKGN